MRRCAATPLYAVVGLRRGTTKFNSDGMPFFSSRNILGYEFLLRELHTNRIATRKLK